MTKLTELRLAYTAPHFSGEYDEAARYPALKHLSRADWVELASTGKAVRASTLKSISNTTAYPHDYAYVEFKRLNAHKRARVEQAIEKGSMEMPIVLEYQGSYELLGGNTRLTGAIAFGHDPLVWVIKLAEPYDEKPIKKRR